MKLPEKHLEELNKLINVLTKATQDIEPTFHPVPGCDPHRKRFWEIENGVMCQKIQLAISEYIKYAGITGPIVDILFDRINENKDALCYFNKETWKE